MKKTLKIFLKYFMFSKKERGIKILRYISFEQREKPTLVHVLCCLISCKRDFG